MKNILLSGLVILLFSNCATIIGGSQYNAKINVINDPNASIEYKGRLIGTGSASLKIKRANADNISFTIKKDGCSNEVKNFTQKELRGWAFWGSLIGWTGFIPGTMIPIPWGIAIDAATGAMWKPNIQELGISKEDYKHYVYTIQYEGCTVPVEKPVVIKTNKKTKIERLKELKTLLDEGIITQSEFDSEKKKILDEEE